MQRVRLDEPAPLPSRNPGDWRVVEQRAVRFDKLIAANVGISELQSRIALGNQKDHRCDHVPHFVALHVHELARAVVAYHRALVQRPLAKVMGDGRVDAAALKPLHCAVEAVGADVVALEVHRPTAIDFGFVQEAHIQNVSF